MHIWSFKCCRNHPLPRKNFQQGEKSGRQFLSSQETKTFGSEEIAHYPSQSICSMYGCSLSDESGFTIAGILQAIVTQVYPTKCVKIVRFAVNEPQRSFCLRQFSSTSRNSNNCLHFCLHSKTHIFRINFNQYDLQNANFYQILIRRTNFKSI